MQIIDHLLRQLSHTDTHTHTLADPLQYLVHKMKNAKNAMQNISIIYRKNIREKNMRANALLFTGHAVEFKRAVLAWTYMEHIHRSINTYNTCL